MTMPPKRRKTYQIISAVSGLLFLLLSLVVSVDVFSRFDYISMAQTQEWVHRVFDVPFSLISILGSSEISLFIVFALYLFVYVRKKKSFAGIWVFFLIFVIELFLKLTIDHPNPPREFNRYALPFSMPSSGTISTQFSFPSGHTARSVFLCVISAFFISRMRLSQTKKTALYALVLFYAGIVIVSRIYLGAHWISDVLGGILLGGSIASLAISLW